MKTLLPLLAAFAVPLLGALGAEKPNVILIISDDQGFPDYGFMGNKAVSTPNLDRMASESLLYTRGYVSPVCSPSLATLLTGKMPHEHGITGNVLSGGRFRSDPLQERQRGNAVVLFLGKKEALLLQQHLGEAFGAESVATLHNTYYMGLEVVAIDCDSFVFAGGRKTARTLQDPNSRRPEWRDRETEGLWQFRI